MEMELAFRSDRWISISTAEVRAHLLLAMEMTEEKLGTGVLTVTPLNVGSWDWTYADSMTNDVGTAHITSVCFPKGSDVIGLGWKLLVRLSPESSSYSDEEV